MVAPALVALVLLGAPPAHPRVDVSAMKEAMEAPTDDYSSASAYAHFLRARLLALHGEHALSVEQLRLALASDPGRPRAGARARRGPGPVRLPGSCRGHRARSPRALAGPRRGAALPRAAALRDGLAAARPRGAGAGAQARPARAGAISPAGGDVARVGPPRRCRANGAGAGRPEPRHHRPQAPGAWRCSTGRARDCPCAAGEDRADSTPGDAEAQGALGEALEALGRPADAEAAYGRALERDPDAREVLLRAGRLALRSGSETRARAYLDRLASLDIGPEHSLRIALTWLSGGKPGPAIRVLEQARAGSRRPPAPARARPGAREGGAVGGRRPLLRSGADRRSGVEGRRRAAGPRAGQGRRACGRRTGHRRGAEAGARRRDPRGRARRGAGSHRPARRAPSSSCKRASAPRAARSSSPRCRRSSPAPARTPRRCRYSPRP